MSLLLQLLQPLQLATAAAAVATVAGWAFSRQRYFPGGKVCFCANIYIENANPDISWMTIIRNRATQEGGGLYISNSTSTTLSHVLIAENISSIKSSIHTALKRQPLQSQIFNLFSMLLQKPIPEGEE